MSENSKDTEYWSLEDTQPIPISTGAFDDVVGWWNRYGRGEADDGRPRVPWSDESRRP